MSNISLEPKQRVRIIVATPTSGSSTVFPHLASLRRVLWDIEKNGADDTEFVDDFASIDARELLHYPTDVVRSRSRMVRLIQKHSKATHVLWLDDDMSFDPKVAIYMISLALKYDLDCIGAVYPRKFYDEKALVEKIKWALSVIGSEGSPAEVSRAQKVLANPLKFAFTQKSFAVYNEPCAEPRKGPHSPHPWLWQLDGLGMGLMLTTRRMLDAMSEKYRDELFVDDADPQIGDMTAMFMLEIANVDGGPSGNGDGNPPGRLIQKHLLSEDNAFMRRWRKMGGKVYGYVGPGQIIHHGSQPFEADVSCLLGEEFAAGLDKIGEPK